jgi:hypothetical protein
MNEQPTEDKEGNPTTEELLVALLARVCVLQGAVDSLLFKLAADRLLADKDDEFSDWFSRVHNYAIAARLGYLTEQFPSLRKLLEDHIEVGNRTAGEIFDALQAKFLARELGEDENDKK